MVIERAESAEGLRFWPARLEDGRERGSDVAATSPESVWRT
jgi:hypothetical protein